MKEGKREGGMEEGREEDDNSSYKSYHQYNTVFNAGVAYFQGDKQRAMG